MMLTFWDSLPSSGKLALSVTVLFLVVASGIATASYVLAWGMGFQIASFRDVFIWLEAIYAGYTDPETVRWIKIGGIAGTLPTLFAVLIALKAKPQIKLHGQARFATKREIRDMDMRSEFGVVCGFTGPLPAKTYGEKVDRFGRKQKTGKVKLLSTTHLSPSNLLIYGGDEHVMLWAPTRSGKTVSVAVPNLVGWPESVIALDVKKELWNLTAGFRQSAGQKVFLFDPLDESGMTHCWNPLDTVRCGTLMQAEDLERIAAMFIPISEGKDPFFDMAARRGFFAVAGWLAEQDRKKYPFTLGEIYRQITLRRDFVRGKKTGWMQDAPGGNPLSEATRAALTDFLSQSENTWSSVKNTITNRLGLYNGPIIDRATSRSDFDLRHLRRDLASIYIGIKPSNIERLAPLLNLFFQSFVDAHLGETLGQSENSQHRVMLLLDEFAVLGDMPVFRKGIAYFAGYGIKVVTILQTPTQLESMFGRAGAKEYKDSSGVEIVFAPKDIEDAAAISKRLGTYGLKSKSESRSKTLANRKGSTVTTSEQRRDLMSPNELTEMDRRRALITIAGHKPIMANKIRFYAEDIFMERIRGMAPPVLKSIRPTDAELEVQKLRQENDGLRKLLLTLENLQEAQKENVEKGLPATVEMTEQEIVEPEIVSMEKLMLRSDSTKAKIAEIKGKGSFDINKLLPPPNELQNDGDTIEARINDR